MSTSYWKRQTEAATALNTLLRDQILSLEAEVIKLRLERSHLLNLIAILSRDLPNAQINDPRLSHHDDPPGGR